MKPLSFKRHRYPADVIRHAGGDLANGQLLVSAVGWADALLQGLVLLAKRDDAAGY